jgi:hypothetical protein
MAKRGRKPTGLEQNRPDLKRPSKSRSASNRPEGKGQSETRDRDQQGSRGEKADGEYVRPGRPTDESQVP